MKAVNASSLLTLLSFLTLFETLCFQRRLNVPQSSDFPRVPFAPPPPHIQIPLHTGDGSHFVYAYVGTPPQRVSVIVDTGSHYTAFPCIGCATCQGHLDPPFDYERSSTHRIPDCEICLNPERSHCEGDACIFTQHYAEGSR